MSAPPRLILTVTTGRSGTRSLAFALGRFRGVVARHEPRPKLSDALGAVRSDPRLGVEFWRDVKLPRIERIARRAGAGTYAETSHLTCKGLLEPLVDGLGVRPSLVWLQRDEREVARSLYRLDTVPLRSYRGVKYYLAANDPCELAVASLDTPATHDYGLCYAYALEIAARARSWARRADELGLTFVRAETGELASRDGIEALGERLGLGRMRATPFFAARLARHRNSKGEKKRALDLSPDALAAEEQRVRAALHDGVESSSPGV